ncbi:MAG: hypothetical protein GX907_04840 [Clostridiaceae bacterium]|nr:hypothetical protein [Clostridiaceae bacterium]
MLNETVTKPAQADIERLRRRERMNILMDLYGSMLTDHTRELLQLYTDEDLTISEIAALHGISRQAVYDRINRGAEQLSAYEANLGQLKDERRLRDWFADFDLWLDGQEAELRGIIEPYLCDLADILGYERNNAVPSTEEKEADLV